MPSAGVRCGDCGDELPDPQPDECPSCGGTARRYAEHGTSTVHVTAEVSLGGNAFQNRVGFHAHRASLP